VVADPLIKRMKHVNWRDIPSGRLSGRWETVYEDPFSGRRPKRAARVKCTVSLSGKHSYSFSLNIMKRRGDYVLWQYFGDPDARDFQEYVRRAARHE